MMHIIGHRGARHEAPENTLAGFRYLDTCAIKAVEFDVRQLKDGELVVIHDNNMLRTSGQDYALEQVSYHELMHCDQAYCFNQAHPTLASWSVQVLPRLNEVIEIIKHFEHIEVEVKPVYDMASAQRLIDRLLSILEPIQLAATITSFDLKVLTALLPYSHFKRGLLVEWPLGQHAIAQAQQLGCNRMGWKDVLVTESLIHQTHQAGLKTSVWTVNDPLRAQTLAQWGVDGVITDIPKHMQNYFQSCLS